MMLPPAQANRKDEAQQKMDRVIRYLNARMSDPDAPRNGSMELWEARRLVNIAKAEITGKIVRSYHLRAPAYVSACIAGLGGQNNYGKRAR